MPFWGKSNSKQKQLDKLKENVNKLGAKVLFSYPDHSGADIRMRVGGEVPAIVLRVFLPPSFPEDRPTVYVISEDRQRTVWADVILRTESMIDPRSCRWDGSKETSLLSFIEAIIKMLTSARLDFRADVSGSAFVFRESMPRLVDSGLIFMGDGLTLGSVVPGSPAYIGGASAFIGCSVTHVSSGKCSDPPHPIPNQQSFTQVIAQLQQYRVQFQEPRVPQGTPRVVGDEGGGYVDAPGFVPPPPWSGEDPAPTHSLPPESVVHVLSEHGPWLRVRWSGKEGFLKLADLEGEEPQPPEPVPRPQEIQGIEEVPEVRALRVDGNEVEKTSQQLTELESDSYRRKRFLEKTKWWEESQKVGKGLEQRRRYLEEQIASNLSEVADLRTLQTKLEELERRKADIETRRSPAALAELSRTVMDRADHSSKSVKLIQEFSQETLNQFVQQRREYHKARICMARHQS